MSFRFQTEMCNDYSDNRFHRKPSQETEKTKHEFQWNAWGTTVFLFEKGQFKTELRGMNVELKEQTKEWNEFHEKNTIKAHNDFNEGKSCLFQQRTQQSNASQKWIFFLSMAKLFVICMYEQEKNTKRKRLILFARLQQKYPLKCAILVKLMNKDWSNAIMAWVPEQNNFSEIRSDAFLSVWTKKNLHKTFKFLWRHSRPFSKVYKWNSLNGDKVQPEVRCNAGECMYPETVILLTRGLTVTSCWPRCRFFTHQCHLSETFRLFPIRKWKSAFFSALQDQTISICKNVWNSIVWVNLRNNPLLKTNVHHLKYCLECFSRNCPLLWPVTPCHLSSYILEMLNIFNITFATMENQKIKLYFAWRSMQAQF